MSTDDAECEGIWFDSPQWYPSLNISQPLSTNGLHSPPTRWYLGTCDLCPGTITLRDDLLTAMDNNMTDSIVFKQWDSVGRSALETVTKPVYEFVKSLCEKLELFFTHSLIAMQQASFYKDHKSALQHGDLLVTADFSENYYFALQDEAKGFH